MTQCPKCGYIRKENETTPEFRCPSCRVIYRTFKLSCPRCGKVSSGTEIKKPDVCPECGVTVSQYVKQVPSGMWAKSHDNPDNDPEFSQNGSGQGALGLSASWNNPKFLIAAAVVLVAVAVASGMYIQKTGTESKEANQAIEALKKLSLRTEVGISYVEYRRVLPELLYPVNEYLKSSAGQRNTETNNIIRAAAADYMLAFQVWGHKINKTSPPNDVVIRVCGRDYEREFRAILDCINDDKALPAIWNTASRRISGLNISR